MPRRKELSSAQVATLKDTIKKQEGSARELARAQAILMHEKGLKADFIEGMTGIKRSVLFKWRARYQQHGIEALKDRERKPKPLLTRGQRTEIVRVLQKMTPRDFGYQTEHWTSTILGHLIKEQYNVAYKSKKRLYLLFREARFTYHKPGQIYRNRKQDQIDQWVLTYTPIIQKHLEEPNTVVLVGDEMVLSTQTTTQKVWIPVNTFPKIEVSNTRKNRSIYGFLNVQAGIEHAFKTAHQNSKITCFILNKLCALYPNKHIVLVWDNASWHRSKEVRAWLSTTSYHITLIAFPTYAPELNPQEHVWKEGRAAVSHNKFIENIDAASADFVAHLNKTSYQYNFLGLVHF
jgi:transposase